MAGTCFGHLFRDHVQDEITRPEQSAQLDRALTAGVFRVVSEAEQCLATGCYRAAAALFRSVLDKTLVSNGYKTSRKVSLKRQFNEAADDGVITEARKKKTHQDIRVLGNDILHEQWRPITESDVEPAHRYIQRILEDLYDDRPSVLRQPKEKERVVDEDEEDRKAEANLS